MSSRVGPVRPTILAGVLAASIAVGLSGTTPRFFPDDPIQVDDDRAVDAGSVAPTRVGKLDDLVANTLGEHGDRRDVRAMNINTLGDVPDSSWFTNRLGRGGMTVDDIVRGPDRLPMLSVDGWPIVQGKGEGLQPGLRVESPEGHEYQLKFDPDHRPEMASSVEIIGTALFHALGYNVPDVYLVEFDPARTEISPRAVIRDGGGRSRRLVTKDIEDALEGAARLPNGRYRALASRFIDGTPLGPFRYWSTRPDDPNDIVPHEHRRELRGMRVFAAWLNHDEANSPNTLDVLRSQDGRRWVDHYLLDFGSLMGSDTTRQERGRGGNEYLLEWMPGLKTAATLGLYARPWLRVDYPSEPRSVGRFEAAFFDPLAWRPVYPNPAFDNMRPDDAFWAARLVARLDEAAIRGVVAKARYSDQRASEYVTTTLRERREKVLRAWLTVVNPVVDPRVDADGVLTFANAAVDAGVAVPPSSYELSWFEFDNVTGREVAYAEPQRVPSPRGSMPSALRTTSRYVGVRVAQQHPEYPHWSTSVTCYFRRGGASWVTVGVER